MYVFLIKRRKVKNTSYCALLLWLMLSSSCSLNRFLKTDEYVVRTNKIVINGEATSRERANINKTLLPLARQKELPSIIVLKSNIGAYNYFKSETLAGKKGLFPSIARTLSKKPFIFDEKMAQLSCDNMRQTLFNSGYWYNKVSYDKLFTGNTKGFADVTYNIELGKLFVFDSVNYVCADTSYLKLLKNSQPQTLLSKGTPVSSSNFEKEKARIADVFNNNGYARFGTYFIPSLDGDTSTVRFNEKNQRLVNATLSVVLPVDTTQIGKFYIGDISVFPNYDIRRGETINFDTVIGTNIVRTYDGKIGLRAGVLKDLISFKNGELYNKSTIAQTDKRLRNFGLFKYVKVIPKIDECDSNSIAFNVYLTPYKRMSNQIGPELNLVSVNSASSGSLFRLGGSVTEVFTHTNLFNGAEKYTGTLTYGRDVGLNKASVNNGVSTDFKFDNQLVFPKVIDLNPAYAIAKGLGLLSQKFTTDFKENANTQVNASLNVTNRIDLGLFRLDRYNINLRDIFVRKNAYNERYIISPTALELNIGTITEAFRSRIAERTLRSFDTTLVTGFLFRSYNYDFATQPDARNQTFRFAYGFQQSGGEVWLYDQLFRADKAPTQLTEKIKFSKFLRFDFDFTYKKEISVNTEFALKASLGLANPYGDLNAAVPFTYQYLLGGPNSIRAWGLGSLGPGGFNDPRATSIFPAQSGEFKFEVNSELRFPLLSFISGAIFGDLGNVWNLKKDEAEPEAELNKFWYQHLAVGTGLGIRVDFTYVLLRLDLGWKLRFPYAKYPDAGYWVPLSKYNFSDQFNLNFGVGYPF